MITLKNVTLRRGTSVLLTQVNWVINPNQSIGLIGANGSGKSSLFAILLSKLQADAGDVEFIRGLTIAHVAQETPASAQSALDYVLDGDAELREIEAKLKIAEDNHDGMRIATLHEHMAVIDAYTAPSRAAQLLSGLGFSEAEQKKSVSEFSGGWRMRLNLAQALMCRSDILLLDEPTNHLDLDAVLWLENWLKKYQGTLVLISHDRDFLDNTVSHIAHLSHQQLKLYTGNYSDFERQHAAELLQQQAIYEKQQRQVKHLQSYVDRFRYKASKARQAQSRLKALERMDLVCAVQEESPFHFHFREPQQCPNPLLTLERVQAGYGERIILSHLNLTLSPKDRIAILGPNGAGKSTFVKTLAGEISPLSGVYEKSSGLKIGYFAQHQVDNLNMQESAFDHMRDLAKNTSELEIRKYLGNFDFSDDKVFAPLKQFSGGEKSRLALALIVWQRPNLLLLDEPTNHLDLEMRHALSIALQEYEGAMILVSHDRFLVRTTTDQLMLVADGKLQTFDGDLDDYQKWLQDFRKRTITESVIPRERKEKLLKNDTKNRDSQRALTQKIKQLETELKKLHDKENQLQETLADTTLYAAENKEKLQKLLLSQTENKKLIEAVESEWLIVCEQQENFINKSE